MEYSKVQSSDRELIEKAKELVNESQNSEIVKDIHKVFVWYKLRHEYRLLFKVNSSTE